MEPNVDFIVNGQAEGQVANYMANQTRLDSGRMRPFVDTKTGDTYITIFKGGDPKDRNNYQIRQLNTNATLRRDEWKTLDDAIMMVGRYRLGGVQDLIANGLTYNLGNAMGTTVLEWHDVSDPMEADVTMDGVTRSQGDRPKYQHNYMPIPIIHVDYEINERELQASRNMGNPLDTTAAESAARRVSEKLENMLFTNTNYSFGEKDARNRNTIYSYVNHPDRNTIAIGTHWDDLVSTIGTSILNQVLAMKAASIADFHYGPWTLYIPTNYEMVIEKDYDTVTPGTTIRERLMKIDGLKAIKVVDTLAADNVLLVEMAPQTVRLVRGMGLTNVQWGTEGNFVTKFKVLTIQVPQIRSDMNKRSGIIHLA
jgi:uncharacterized linocin/CFP29 family protein